MIKYVSTAALCDIYDVGDDFFLRRKEEGELEQNIHFVQRSRTIRWNLYQIEQWWRGEGPVNGQVDQILSKVI